MTNQSSPIWIILAFGMLWVPVGQHDFLLAHWMKLGTFMAPFLLLIAFAMRSGQEKRDRPDVRLFALILLISYIVHQFEEHWVDVFGNIYAFKPFLNGMLLNALGAAEGTPPPLSDAGVFIINTSLTWLVASLAIWRGPKHIFPTLCMAAIVAINAVSHIVSGVLNTAYNPGLVTSILVFLPVSIAIYAQLLRTGKARSIEVVASLIWGLLGHLVMIAGMILTGYFRLIPELVYFIVLILWSVLPLLFYRRTSI